MSEQRLIALEIKLMEQEQDLEALNDALQQQWKEIDQLKAQLRQAHNKINRLEEISNNDQQGMSITEEARQNIPPHY